MKPDEFQRCLYAFAENLHNALPGEVPPPPVSLMRASPLELKYLEASHARAFLRACIAGPGDMTAALKILSGFASRNPHGRFLVLDLLAKMEPLFECKFFLPDPDDKEGITVFALSYTLNNILNYAEFQQNFELGLTARISPADLLNISL